MFSYYNYDTGPRSLLGHNYSRGYFMYLGLGYLIDWTNVGSIPLGTICASKRLQSDMYLGEYRVCNTVIRTMCVFVMQ